MIVNDKFMLCQINWRRQTLRWQWNVGKTIFQKWGQRLEIGEKVMQFFGCFNGRRCAATTTTTTKNGYHTCNKFIIYEERGTHTHWTWYTNHFGNEQKNKWYTWTVWPFPPTYNWTPSSSELSHSTHDLHTNTNSQIFLFSSEQSSSECLPRPYYYRRWTICLFVVFVSPERKVFESYVICDCFKVGERNVLCKYWHRTQKTQATLSDGQYT